jgi:hypothetical protein
MAAKDPRIAKPVKVAAGASTERDAFKAVAKRLECDEDRGRFEAKLGKLAKAKPTGGKK